MPKPKLTDFKKYLTSLDEAALQEELLRLFSVFYGMCAIRASMKGSDFAKQPNPFILAENST